MKRLLLLSVLLITLTDAHSQSVVRSNFSARSGLSGGFDVGIALKKNYVNPSVTYYELTSLVKNESLFVGWTGRLSAFYGNDLDYYTAPSRLTRVQNIDTIRFDYLSQTSLDFGLRAELNLGRLQVGASVDLLGFTFLGRSRIGLVYSSTGRFNGKDSLNQDVQKPFQGADAYQQASPTRFNVRLLGDNDRGMLTTEVYARIHLLPRVALKVGYQWLATEMAVDNVDQVANNNRFRNRVGLPYAALTFPLTPW